MEVRAGGFLSGPGKVPEKALAKPVAHFGRATQPTWIVDKKVKGGRLAGVRLKP